MTLAEHQEPILNLLLGILHLHSILYSVKEMGKFYVLNVLLFKTIIRYDAFDKSMI